MRATRSARSVGVAGGGIQEAYCRETRAEAAEARATEAVAAANTAQSRASEAVAEASKAAAHAQALERELTATKEELVQSKAAGGVSAAGGASAEEYVGSDNGAKALVDDVFRNVVRQTLEENLEVAEKQVAALTAELAAEREKTRAWLEQIY